MACCFLAMGGAVPWCALGNGNASLLPPPTQVASLLGTKTIVNEFVAYTKLSALIHAGSLSDHSVILASYALCGFSNLGGIGVPPSTGAGGRMKDN